MNDQNAPLLLTRQMGLYFLDPDGNLLELVAYPTRGR